MKKFTITERSVGNGNDSSAKVKVVLLFKNEEQELEREGNGPLDAFCNSLRTMGYISIESYYEHSLKSGSESKAISYIKIIDKNSSEGANCWWGVGVDTDTILAAIKAIISALNRYKRKEV